MSQESLDVRITRAGPSDLDAAAPLFDAYRQSYQKPASQEAARRFLAARFARQDSVLLLGYSPASNAHPSGFVHLYPSFDSLAMCPLWILYDLYVAPEARRRGLARVLMNRAATLALETGASSIILETAKDNHSAQALYEQLGYRRDELFHRYALSL